MINSRQKGAAAERDVAKLFREHSFPARRGQQHSGHPDAPDVVVEDTPLHIEVKDKQVHNFWDHMKQAEADSSPDQIPVVFARRKTKNKREPWLVTMRAEDWFSFLDWYMEQH